MVEQTFSLHTEGRTLQLGVLGVHARDGGFHIKAAGLKLDRTYFAAKVNGNSFYNMDSYRMPNIQGTILLCDGENGYPFRELATAVRESDICVTCTLSRQHYGSGEIVAPGTFTAAVGVNNEEKQELDPLMYVERKIVVNLLEQAMRDH